MPLLVYNKRVTFCTEQQCMYTHTATATGQISTTFLQQYCLYCQSKCRPTVITQASVTTDRLPCQ